MNIKIKDLVKLTTAAKNHRIDINDILIDSLEDKLPLFALATECKELDLIPCKKQWIEEEKFYIDSYNSKDVHWVEVKVGTILQLNEAAIKSLIVNQQFSEAELYRNLGPDLKDSEYEYWKTTSELYPSDDWVNGSPVYRQINIDSIYSVTTKFNSYRESPLLTKTETTSKTALKVIGLLMHYLAKSPKYASGTSPNKSQIKELLLDLATELKVNQYGLSKVDERLLVDAMKYLEEQKL